MNICVLVFRIDSTAERKSVEYCKYYAGTDHLEQAHGEMGRVEDQIFRHGCNTGYWLLVMIAHVNGTILGYQDMRDTLFV